jgi:hypothetical protein
MNEIFLARASEDVLLGHAQPPLARDARVSLVFERDHGYRVPISNMRACACSPVGVPSRAETGFAPGLGPCQSR